MQSSSVVASLGPWFIAIALIYIAILIGGFLWLGYLLIRRQPTLKGLEFAARVRRVVPDALRTTATTLTVANAAPFTTLLASSADLAAVAPGSPAGDFAAHLLTSTPLFLNGTAMGVMAITFSLTSKMQWSSALDMPDEPQPTPSKLSIAADTGIMAVTAATILISFIYLVCGTLKLSEAYRGIIGTLGRPLVQ